MKLFIEIKIKVITVENLNHPHPTPIFHTKKYIMDCFYLQRRSAKELLVIRSEIVCVFVVLLVYTYYLFSYCSSTHMSIFCSCLRFINCYVYFSFGKRTGGSARRPNECFVLEPSEMIVVSFFACLLIVKITISVFLKFIDTTKTQLT